MLLLGIHDGHNSSACLFSDGEILFAIQEERLTNIKNFFGLPIKCIKLILKKFNLSPCDIDKVILNGFKVPNPVQVNEMLSSIRSNQKKKFYNIIKQIARNSPIYNLYVNNNKSHRIKQIVKLGFKVSQIDFIEHHLAHASSAYYGSPWWNKNKKVLILTLDGGGDKICSTVSIGENAIINRLHSSPDSNSIGILYSLVTFLLGFVPLEHEYKLMGLAPYASEKNSITSYKTFSSYLCLDSKNKNLTFNRKIIEPISSSYSRLRSDLELQRFDSVCRGLQDFCEDIVVKWIKSSIKETKINTLCLSGGVFMNVKVNKRIMELPEVQELFIFPSCGDETNIFGAVWNNYITYKTERNESIDLKSFGPFYFGSEIKNENVEPALRKLKKELPINYNYREDINDYVGELLGKNEIVARANGKMEFGARALGNRSILADASDLKNIRILNMMVKNRDFWMPFAPAIMSEYEKKYIINKKNIPSPYMILSYDTTSSRNEIIAAIHQADLTARPQIVYKDWNHEYHSIIARYEKITNTGGLLNTSFNLHGFPIVNGINDALWVFKNCGLKFLQLGDYIVEKTI